MVEHTLNINLENQAMQIFEICTPEITLLKKLRHYKL